MLLDMILHQKRIENNVYVKYGRYPSLKQTKFTL